MKKKLFHPITALLVTGVLAFSLAGCGASSSSYDQAAVEEPAAMETTSSSIYSAANMAGVRMEESPAEEAVEEEIAVEDGAAKAEEIPEETSRKLIKTVHMDVETENYPELITNISDKVSAKGGYIEFYESYNENNIGNRGSSFKLRIPAGQLDTFIDEVSEISNITYRQESVEDVTLEYVDLESHKKMLLEEQERLLELLEEAETIEDIISIESRLTDVRYQLESMESQLRTIDNKVTYSTIYLNINEVERYTPPVEKGAWERMSTGFVENVYNVIDGFREFGINFVIAIPVLIVYAVIIIVLLLIIRAVRKRIARKDLFRRSKMNQNVQNTVPGMYGAPAQQPQMQTSSAQEPQKTDTENK